MKISVLGDGGWGTALALLLTGKGHDVTLWGAFPEYTKVLRERRENVKFLKGFSLPPGLDLSSDLDASVAKSEILVFAIPSQFLRNVIYKIKADVLRDRILVSVAKGIERKTLLRPSQIIAQQAHSAAIAVLSGPSHAEEVAQGVPTCVVAASNSREVARRVQSTFMDTRFRVYTSDDVTGVELGGALKNIIAIAAGICDGLKFGSNAKAALLSRGLFEITRLGIHMGANPNTFFGLSGMGDLVTTCISEYGRNRRVGELIGQGKKLSEILAGMEMVAEGVETTRSAVELAQKYNVEMPITAEIHKVLFEDKNPVEAVDSLMMRDAKMEIE
ncbi:MAG: NAD(P)H-dependent glycerol-3-phosphate dehydrogenase [Candidatus Omnitrophica bacterium]|nr:NAD(P)H-dependent glycerol-3-phosphate dehydrogenase [Candidatus Omnitrophota bacterium]